MDLGSKTSGPAQREDCGAWIRTKQRWTPRASGPVVRRSAHQAKRLPIDPHSAFSMDWKGLANPRDTAFVMPRPSKWIPLACAAMKLTDPKRG